MEQAKRYSRGAASGPGNWNGFHVPFLYATNGENIWHLDVRSDKPISRTIVNFHTATALAEQFALDDSKSRKWLLDTPPELVSVRGTLGGVAVVPDSLSGWNISREVAVVPIKGIVPEFVAFWIASVRCQNWLSGVAKGVAYTGINIADLKLLPIALPSLAEQQEIVRRVAGLFALADQLEQRLAQARKQVDQLTPSVLARAFAGQLVSQNPADEPAEKLLQRIKTC